MANDEGVERLRALREEMIEHRTALAYRVHGATNYDGMAKLVTVHHAIEALDAVINSGAGEPPSPFDDPNYKPMIIG